MASAAAALLGVAFGHLKANGRLLKNGEDELPFSFIGQTRAGKMYSERRGFELMGDMQEELRRVVRNFEASANGGESTREQGEEEPTVSGSKSFREWLVNHCAGVYGLERVTGERDVPRPRIAKPCREEAIGSVEIAAAKGHSTNPEFVSVGFRNKRSAGFHYPADPRFEE